MPVFSNKLNIFLLVLIAGVLVWNQCREQDHLSVRETPRLLPKITLPTSPSPVETPHPATERPVPSPAVEALPSYFNEIPTAREDISEDLNAVDFAIRNFQTVLGENPIGSNAEITGALLGNNLKQVKLSVPAGSQLDGEGQLCDRWGTPYFFHQVSATEMQIRSAGPDRKMWTGDDSQM